MKRYVVVYNTENKSVPLRHIVTWETNETFEDFKKLVL